MRKFLAGVALTAALVAGTATVATAPAQAAGIYVSVGDHHHWDHDRRWHHDRYWHHHGRGYYWHRHYWHNRYRCHHGWCYR